MCDCCSTEPTASQIDAQETVDQAGEDCCAVPAAPAESAQKSAQAPSFHREVTHCPECGAKGRKMDTQTVKALLAVSLRTIREVGYRFCATESCPVVYFSQDGEQRFTEADLRERVHQKHPLEPDVFVCYCFRHTPGSIRLELERTGATTALEDIKTGIQAGQCACEIRNPQGSCCLGNVSNVVKALEKQILSPALEN